VTSEPECVDVDELMRYRRSGEPVVHEAVASGYTFTDLHRGGLIDDECMERLAEIAWCLECQGRFCESSELLDAWLDAFELLASAHESDFRPPTNRFASEAM
jgi:hypothetical protein